MTARSSSDAKRRDFCEQYRESRSLPVEKTVGPSLYPPRAPVRHSADSAEPKIPIPNRLRKRLQNWGTSYAQRPIGGQRLPATPSAPFRIPIRREKIGSLKFGARA